jgi:lysophospholipase L1-like esterase
VSWFQLGEPEMRPPPPAIDPRSPSEFERGASLRGWLAIFVGNLLLFALVLGAAEVGLQLLIAHPFAVPEGRLLEILRQLYIEQRGYIQYDPDCAAFDEVLTYTLRPGTCTFANSEFSHAYFVNELGVRDDERSLRAPEIVVLGDSFAMGWGVAAQETFPELLEARVGVPVLNAGISSFGTARELMLLERIDTSRLRVLVLQYSDNDFEENATFRGFAGHLPTRSRDAYDELVAQRRRAERYWFGRHTARVVRTLLRRLTRSLRPVSSSAPQTRFGHGDVEVEAFLDPLLRTPVDLRGVEIVVVELLSRGAPDAEFVETLASWIADDRAGGLHLQPLDLSGVLQPEHQLRLDDHLNPLGHRVVAEAILASPVFAEWR